MLSIQSSFFSDSSRDVAIATNFVAKLWQNYLPSALIALSFRNKMGYRYLNVRVNSVNDASIQCEKFMKFGPETPEFTKLICECQVQHGQKNWRTQSNIFGYTGPIFAVFLPYESTLRADEGSVPYFPILQVTLPWQPNNVAKMLSTRLIHLHSFHQCQKTNCNIMIQLYALTAQMMLLHCVSKNDNDVLRYNFNAHQPILIIFGKNIAE